MKALGPQHCPLMPVTAAPSLPRYSVFFDVAGSDEGRRARGEPTYCDMGHRMDDRSAGLCIQGKLGRSAMKTLLVGIALAIGIASQAFALPCPHGTWQNGHYVCADYDQ